MAKIDDYQEPTEKRIQRLREEVHPLVADIEEYRINRQMTQEAIANELGLLQPTYNSWVTPNEDSQHRPGHLALNRIKAYLNRAEQSPEPTPEELIRFVEDYRRAEGMTYQDMAELCLTSRQTYMRWLKLIHPDKTGVTPQPLARRRLREFYNSPEHRQVVESYRSASEGAPALN